MAENTIRRGNNLYEACHETPIFSKNSISSMPNTPRPSEYNDSPSLIQVVDQNISKL